MDKSSLFFLAAKMSATIEPNLALVYKENFPNRCLFTKDWESLASDWSDRFRADANDIQVPLQVNSSKGWIDCPVAHTIPASTICRCSHGMESHI